MQQRNFKQDDGFTAGPYRGHALAVVLDGGGLPDEAMQHIAHWTNLCAPVICISGSVHL